MILEGARGGERRGRSSQGFKNLRFYMVFGAFGFKNLSLYNVFGAFGFKNLRFYMGFPAFRFKNLRFYKDSGSLGFKNLRFYKVSEALGLKNLRFHKVFVAFGFENLRICMVFNVDGQRIQSGQGEPIKKIPSPLPPHSPPKVIKHRPFFNNFHYIFQYILLVVRPVYVMTR